MKKLTALLLSLFLLLALGTAAAATYTADGVYTLEYPDTLTLDDTTYAEDSAEDDLWLFVLQNDDYLIDAYITATGMYEDVSLTNATQTEIQEYLDETAATFATQNSALVGTLTSQGGTLFYLYAMSDSVGPYYYAETIESGDSINFICYYQDSARLLDARLLDDFKAVLSTYVPDAGE